MATPPSGRTQKIWRDGQLVGWEEATIHVVSHVVHYGSSVFEGIRCYSTPKGPAVFRLREHMRRLLDSCKIYRLAIVVRTGEQMGVFAPSAPIETFIIAWTMGAYLGVGALENGVDVCVSSWRRAAPDTFPAMAKAGGNYLNSQLSKMEARQDSYVEGIMLDSFGYISEGSGENLFVVRDNVLFTSPLASGILNGITRDSIKRIAQDLGYEVREQVLPREMLYIADELFFTGTAAEITPIRSVDRLVVGEGKPGPITLAVQDRYMGIVSGRYPDPDNWLTMVPAAVGATR